ncbi:undecaprenyl-diphosphate phosphatase [Haladaptatus sp. AB618]|uniref:undecaprenyl-diphosphate phosphatase n=1 Tax=Haladaptatus sp. AB618 TaxID=2934173 RepID=UPI00209C2F95|nr:undecaprenyl-diphosphate phosphatase [Haladaptatus sp. AB618]MCO8256368.1 undecaprenyl-diphosphate phosphatase [Haladaptatus sp. AB618]
MVDTSLVIAFVTGILQGIFEWLPISSEGNITLFLRAMGKQPEAALQFSLFLHLGTAIAATVYYRGEIQRVLESLPTWRPRSAFDERQAELSFIVVGTFASGIVGILAYATLDAVVSDLAGGGFVALIGVLLIGTGILLRTADRFELGNRETPTLRDAVLVGSMQGLSILPGVSRSGTTAGTLLFRGYDGVNAFRLSFLLSIPAAAGAGMLVVLKTGALPTVSLKAAVIAIGTSAVIGYLTIDALLRVVERVSFWAVCVGIGTLAVLGGVFLFTL